MLAIKLKRIGKKHQAAFRVVVTPKKSKLDGKCIEDLGWYNPHTHLSGLKNDRINYWISVGAKPTDTMHNLLVSKQVIKGKKVPLHKAKKEEAKDKK